MHKLLLFLSLAGPAYAQVDGRGTDPYNSMGQQDTADIAAAKARYEADQAEAARLAAANLAEKNRIALAKADARIAAENRLAEEQAAQNRVALAAADARTAQSQLSTPSAPVPSTDDGITISKTSLLTWAGGVVGVGLLVGAFLLGKRRATLNSRPAR